MSLPTPPPAPQGLVKDGDVILFKYLPPQIGWRTVFFWEYFGPMLTFPIMYLHSVRVLCFGEEAAALPITWVQQFRALWCHDCLC